MWDSTGEVPSWQVRAAEFCPEGTGEPCKVKRRRGVGLCFNEVLKGGLGQEWARQEPGNQEGSGETEGAWTGAGRREEGGDEGLRRWDEQTLGDFKLQEGKNWVCLDHHCVPSACTRPIPRKFFCFCFRFAGGGGKVVKSTKHKIHHTNHF